MIVHPAGQDVKLSYSGLRPVYPNETQGWMIGIISYGVSSLFNGILDGYSADYLSRNNNLIIKNITVNDDRNDTKYRCAILSQFSYFYHYEVVESGNATILYVAGEYLIFYVSVSFTSDPINNVVLVGLILKLKVLLVHHFYFS